MAWVEPSDGTRRRAKEDASEPVESGSSESVVLAYLREASESELEDDLEPLESERGGLKWRVANGRARSKSRRYFVCNRLRYMWVLTFEEEHLDRGEVMRLVGEFARRLRCELVGEPFPYWYSPELHPKGHGWHVNLFVPMWLDWARVGEVWGDGYVWAVDFEKSFVGPKGEPLGLCRTPREGWRRAARYGCKYAQKDWAPGSIGRGRHRYEVAQGFSPVPERSWLEAQNEAWDLVAELVPEGQWDLLEVWESSEDPEWDRPPVATFRW